MHTDMHGRYNKSVLASQTINHQTKMKSTKHKYSYTVNLNDLLYSRKSHTWRVLFYVDIGTQMKYKALYT